MTPADRIKAIDAHLNSQCECYADRDTCDHCEGLDHKTIAWMFDRLKKAEALLNMVDRGHPDIATYFAEDTTDEQ